MYGGDEVSALVVDCGGVSCKAGYAGEDTPKAVFPSWAGVLEKREGGGAVDGTGDTVMADAATTADANGAASASKPGPSKRYYVGNTTGVTYRRDHMEVSPVLKDGLIADWDMMEAIWDHAFKERLMVDPKEHPVLLAEPGFAPREQRERVCQVMFETYGVPALFMARNPVLTSFAAGRATSLVVDSGGGQTIVQAVHDGYALSKSIVRSPVGGESLTNFLLKSLEAKGTQVRPRYSFKRKEVSQPGGELEIEEVDLPHTMESYRQYMQMQIVADIKESICRVSESAFDEAASANMPTMSYELPDGNVVEIGADRFKLPEVLFNPSIAKTYPGGEALLPAVESKGVPALVIESINRCDVDARRDLFNGVLLSGGTSLFPNMKERVERELLELAPQTARIKVIASTVPNERRFSVWIGGSILASLGSFQQMWLSKAEYEEHGTSMIGRKCP
eukprot:jgi/Chlat1/4178/Chrsp27S04278